MRRRDFITLLGGASAAWPGAARAQQPTMPVIGFLNINSPSVWAPYLTAFRNGLKDAGYVEGQNVAIEYRWAEGQYDRLPALIADLVRRQVAVIATNGPTALLAKAATSTIPIVFYSGNDPVAVGLVASLNRPGGNLTGVANLTTELVPKRLEVLHELLPKATAIAVLVNPIAGSTKTQLRVLQTAALSLGRQLHILRASTEREIDGAFATLGGLRVGGLVIGNDVFFISRSEQIAALTVRYAVPAIYQAREFVAAGGLVSYGASDTDAWHEVGGYIGRILAGAKPADLPVQQATKVELIINLKTAKALGITIPLPLLTRADEVIE
jgi:putative tryptophan/tyrosine transport system substrate-binding protein